MRRAQFEAMGLAIIVILVSLALFLYVFFALEQSKAGFVARYNNEQLAQNTIDAMLKTSADNTACPNTDVADLIEDLFVLNRNPCSTQDEVKPSEEVLTAIIEPILTKTLVDQEIPYYFTIAIVEEDEESEEPRVESGECDRELQKQYQLDRPGEQILTLFPSLERVRVKLVICAELVQR